MPDEALIIEIENILADVVKLGGQSEQTRIVPNLKVTDADPTGLTGFVTVSDNRDTDNILAKKVPDVVYTTNDLVNVIFTEGGEAIAFQQGSQSASSGIWSIAPGTSTDIYYNKGNVGIGTATPSAKLVLYDSGADTPVQFINDGDIATPFSVGIPVNDSSTIGRLGAASTSTGGMAILGFTSDVVGATGIWIEGYNGSTSPTAPAIYLNGYKSNGATGAAAMAASEIILQITNAFSTKLVTVLGNGDTGFGTVGPDAKVDILDTTGAQLRLTHTDGSKFVDFTLDTNHDLTVKPSSTGQIKLQPTTDSVDFFQVLDADGGTPVLNVDSTNERVGIKIAAPTVELDVVGGFKASGVWDMPSTAYFRGNAAQGFRFNNAADTLNLFIIDDSGDISIPNGYVDISEMTTPGNPAANTARLYVDDDATFTRVTLRFSGGHTTVIGYDGGWANYTLSNVTADRVLDADSTTLAEVADVLGTLIQDFINMGVLS